MLRGNSRPDMRVRDLRHSCATLLLAQSVSPRVILETSRALSDLAHSEHVRPVLPPMQVRSGLKNGRNPLAKRHLREVERFRCS
jgi:hypothetical protein